MLKLYDAGVFIVDADYKVFHVLHKDGEPSVVKTSVSPDFETRHVSLTESRQRTDNGLVVEMFQDIGT